MTCFSALPLGGQPNVPHLMLSGILRITVDWESESLFSWRYGSSAMEVYGENSVTMKLMSV